MSGHRQGRVAFLLNANAKSVTRKQKRRLSLLIPKEDLYISHSLDEAQEKIAEIMSQGYAYLFSGGGDGTAVSTINLLSQYARIMPEHLIPRMGVLKLGTGNALARLLGAHEPQRDVRAIMSGKTLKPLMVSMVETNEGILTPFAGIGYDGELINDFEKVKQVFFESPLRKFFSSLVGFIIAGLFKTLPRQAGKNPPTIMVTSSQPYYRIAFNEGKDEEIYIDEGTTLYKAIAPLICVGTIPSLGYGINMFPFALKRPGYMHLRISAVPLPTAIANLYPKIWHGTFRHPELYDFLVKDVTIESDASLPYQLAGDAMGYKKKLYFKVSTHPIAMASLGRPPKKGNAASLPLMTPLG
ncbi:MAG TPA: diacylglycerol kinase family protein [Myxococcota bacterium]|nr:diacylglycerol kinase family protein [Myxococcota bacterium]